MIISCGAALFGLRLAVRGLGYLPVIELMPDPNQPRLLARVGMGAAVPVTREERRMLDAVPHRHTHRGPFEPGPLPTGLLGGLQHDALAEGAELALVEGELAYQRLASVVAVTASRMDLDPRARAETRQWTRGADSLRSRRRPGRGLHGPSPAQAQAAAAAARLRPGPRPGLAARRRESPSATAVLVTRGDRRVDWLHAGQALHRLLLHATSTWVFASLYTEPLEATVTRALIRDRLALAGNPQLMLQFGHVRTTHPTARRPADEIIDPEVRISQRPSDLAV